mmetsp:Transcript_2059/g.4902  ORF Transcript_2059/g.4902 Transcript_2059/m.4902 type:complete len:307 (+) Transcript_2059:736-1656(+)
MAPCSARISSWSGSTPAFVNRSASDSHNSATASGVPQRAKSSAGKTWAATRNAFCTLIMGFKFSANFFGVLIFFDGLGLMSLAAIAYSTMRVANSTRCFLIGSGSPGNAASATKIASFSSSSKLRTPSSLPGGKIDGLFGSNKTPMVASTPWESRNSRSITCSKCRSLSGTGALPLASASLSWISRTPSLLAISTATGVDMVLRRPRLTTLAAETMDMIFVCISPVVLRKTSLRWLAGVDSLVIVLRSCAIPTAIMSSISRRWAPNSPSPSASESVSALLESDCRRNWVSMSNGLPGKAPSPSRTG